MALPTAYNNGALVTSTATETGITIKGDFPMDQVVTCAITLVSGSLQLTVQPKEDVFSPVIDAGYVTWSNSTAGSRDKIVISFNPVYSEIRMKGVATFALNW